MYNLGAHKNIYAFIVQLKPWLKNKAKKIRQIAIRLYEFR